jgi:arsenate reductase
MKKTVLFLCTGNSCRSQMAEGLVNHALGDRWKAFSAGTAPAGYVHPLAVELVRELTSDPQWRQQAEKQLEVLRGRA